jgi:hypothetical protein
VAERTSLPARGQWHTGGTPARSGQAAAVAVHVSRADLAAALAGQRRRGAPRRGLGPSSVGMVAPV